MIAYQLWKSVVYQPGCDESDPYTVHGLNVCMLETTVYGLIYHTPVAA